MQIIEQYQGIRATLRGWQVTTARLSLDGDTRQRVGFVADFDGKRRTRSRTLCSQGVALAMPGQGNCLTPPWGKPFQLGKLAVALLPAGSSPAAAMLRLHFNGQTVLDARHFAAESLTGAPTVEFREAHGLLLDATAGHVRGASVGELDAWLEEIAEALAHGPGQLLVDDALCGAWAAQRLAALVPGLQVRLPAPLRRAWGWWSPQAPPPKGTKRSGGPWLEVAMRDEASSALTRWALHDPLRAPPAESERALAFRRHAAGTQIDMAIEQTGASWALLQDDAEGHLGATALADRLQRRGVQSWLLRPAKQMILV